VRHRRRIQVRLLLQLLLADCEASPGTLVLHIPTLQPEGLMLFRSWRPVVLVLGESTLLLAAVATGTYLRLGEYGLTLLFTTDGFFKAMLIVGVCQVCLYYGDLYELRGIGNLTELLVRLIQALGATSMILALAYYWFPDWIIGRGVFLVAAGLVASLVVLWRLIFAWLTRYASPSERLLLVGTEPAAVELARELHERRQELGVEIVGFVDPDPSRVGAQVLNPGVVGTIDDIPLL